MKQIFRYDTIFTYGSLQSVGHTMEYFIRHTRKLVIFIVMPRVNGTHNFLRIYQEGKLVDERAVSSSGNIVLYYLLWWYHHNVFLLTYFRKSERVLVFVSHPIALIGMSIIKILRSVKYAYWIGDYYPPIHWSLIVFEWLKKFYHDRVEYAYYLSDRINSEFNGRVLSAPKKRTVMWGVALPKRRFSGNIRSLKLLFVGVVKPGQGLEQIFAYLEREKTIALSVIGVCETRYYRKLRQLAKKLRVGSQIFFPNKFYSDNQLRRFARRHHIGVALYEDSPKSATYYTDPGKVKTYIEIGLPVVMTDTSAVAAYIRRFGCGITIADVGDLFNALNTIKSHYRSYQRGLAAFARYFEYESYYKDAFRALERPL